MRAAIVQRRPSSGAGVKTMLLATTLLVCATLPVSAQDTIQTLPGANTYQLPPGNSQAVPSPTPTPSPTPSAVTPPPVSPAATRPRRMAPPMEPAPRIAIGGSEVMASVMRISLRSAPDIDPATDGTKEGDPARSKPECGR